MRRVVQLLLVMPFLLATASSVGAQPCTTSHCDVLLARLQVAGDDCPSQTFDHSQTQEYSQLITGAVDFGSNPVSLLYPISVWDVRLDGNDDQDDPGFAAGTSPCNLVPSAFPLPPNTNLYLDFLTEQPTAGGAARNLLYWEAEDTNMSGGLDENDVSWVAVPNQEFFAMTEGPTVVADGGTSEVEGLRFDITGDTGGIHDHVSFSLRSNVPGEKATRGVYLVRLDYTVPGFAEGAPFYFVYATDQVDADAEFVARTQVENQLDKPRCSDGVDNDRDGLVDFAGGDPGCDSATDTSEKSALLECDDGIDNDLDGKIDFRSDPFGAADLFNNLTDQECTGPDDASGEAVAVPALGPGGIAALGFFLVLAGVRALRSLMARRA